MTELITTVKIFMTQALILLENINLGWKGVPGTNTLAYLAHS
jgi:hypothetical protein